MTLTTLGTDSDAPVEYDGDSAAVGPEYDGRDASVASRIVTGDSDLITAPSDSRPAYRLVVRVW